MDPRRNFLERISENDRRLSEAPVYEIGSSEPDQNNNEKIFSDFDTNEIKVFTNFTKEEVLFLFSKVDIDISKIRNIRGPKLKLSNLDAFFLLLIYLKTYQSYAVLARTFRISKTSIQTLIEKMLVTLSIRLKLEFIIALKKEEQVSRRIGFDNYQNVALVLDCSVQEIPRFHGGFSEVKTFYSQKHKIYCVKKEFAHLPNGSVAFISEFVPGSVHDFTLFLKSVPKYISFLKKQNNENEYWSIMVDKGYEGANHHIPSVIPKKGTNLQLGEIRENAKISSCRIICENYYGRLKTLWGAARNKVRTDLKNYDSTIDLCVALTNYHISLHPLRNQEAQIHRNMRNSLASSDTSISNLSRNLDESIN